ncbi:hypothetical protein [Flavobacterium sp. UMI-01]|uniref:hypothetical protein n=1 Tax=Flavobacterium sp. UMI-01 TaxID=1441053 RepID=UPI001C7CDBC1|nr:hypothetical protein [Flavobacterium sp. UMI-01]GIZ09882.1 hypothetical protein FUMI01_26080 [Flavobacterium sp. UMI-01]
MKQLYLFLLLFEISSIYSQPNFTKITTPNQVLYLTTTIDIPVNGTYLYEGQTEPIVVLNPNGTGVFQLKDLSKKNIHWGIETSEDGRLKFEEGFNSAAYIL